MTAPYLKTYSLSHIEKYEGKIIAEISVLYSQIENDGKVFSEINEYIKNMSENFFENSKNIFLENVKNFYISSDDKRKKFRFVPFKLSFKSTVVFENDFTKVSFDCSVLRKDKSIGQKSVVRNFDKHGFITRKRGC